MKGFVRKRVSRVLFPWIVATAIYFFYWMTVGGFETVLSIKNNRRNGYLLITNSWFVISVVIFYIIFWASAQLTSQKWPSMSIVCTIAVILYIILFETLGFGSWWYYSSFSFIAGMVWKNKEDNIKIKIQKHWAMSIILFIGVWGLGYALRLINNRMLQSNTLFVIVHLISSTAFPLLVVTLFGKYQINNKGWAFLGEISFEIYLLHELVYNVLRSKETGLNIKNDTLYVVITLLITIFVSYLLHRFFRATSFKEKSTERDEEHFFMLGEHDKNTRQMKKENYYSTEV